MKRALAVVSPIGPLWLEEEDGAISGLRFAAPAAPARPALEQQTSPLLEQAKQQLAEYFAGQRQVFDLPLRVQGTPFQQRVWAALREIPYGQTRSYKQIAEQIGSPNASRAVGMANNRNPIAILIPCHRVIGADGSLTGYAGGLAAKERLLALERRNRQR